MSVAGATQPRSKLWLYVGSVIAIALAIVLGPRVIQGWRDSQSKSKTEPPAARPKVTIEAKDPSVVVVPSDVYKTLGIKTAEVTPYREPRQLKLSGTLFVDPSRLARIHSRFAGEVMQLGPRLPAEGDQSPRLKFGDQVKKGQLLCVVWSKDLGEKKSELIDAILHRQLDEETFKRLQALFQEGATPEQKVRDSQHNYEADVIAETRAERTLRSWRLGDDEIRQIRAEADAIRANRFARDQQREANWSRVDVVAPINGVVIELNVGPGDIVDTTVDLMKLADLSRLRVMCHLFEEQLPLVQNLPDSARRWSIRIGGEQEGPALQGAFEKFDQIGHIVDPNTHTAPLLGWVDNPDDRYLIGQFVTATVDLASPTNLAAVPVSAVIETGSGALVLVKTQGSTDEETRFQRRQVLLAREGQQIDGILASPDDAQRKQGFQPLQPQETVVSDGALLLSAEMDEQQQASGGKN